MEVCQPCFGWNLLCRELCMNLPSCNSYYLMIPWPSPTGTASSPGAAGETQHREADSYGCRALKPSGTQRGVHVSSSKNTVGRASELGVSSSRWATAEGRQEPKHHRAGEEDGGAPPSSHSAGLKASGPQCMQPAPDGRGRSKTQKKLQPRMSVCVCLDTDIVKVFFLYPLSL